MKNPHAVALGRLGGLRGGPTGGRARAAVLSARRRTEIARLGAAARWGRLPEFLRPLFPGYALENIKLPDHADLVMLHILTRGGPEHRRWVVHRLGDRAIRQWILKNKGRGLTVEQMAPWVSRRTARAWMVKNPYAYLWVNR